MKPTGYVEAHEWAEKLMKRGAKQSQCPICQKWFFKCEKHSIKACKKANLDAISAIFKR